MESPNTPGDRCRQVRVIGANMWKEEPEGNVNYVAWRGKCFLYLYGGAMRSNNGQLCPVPCASSLSPEVQICSLRTG